MEFLGKNISIDKTEVITLNQVEFTFKLWYDKSLHIERVFIDKSERGKGYLAKALKIVTIEADKKSVILSLNILPDINTADNADKLRNTFLNAGFKPLEMDGGIYRNDLERKPDAL